MDLLICFLKGPRFGESGQTSQGITVKRPTRGKRKRLPVDWKAIHWRLNQLIFMAKTSWIEREKKKSATVAKYAALRAELKAKGDYIGLSLLPRNASPVRVSKRCLQSGRKRAYIGRFKLSRIAFRELASHGMIPGVTKSSW
jgi:small subunit ribosomal protein S14